VVIYSTITHGANVVKEMAKAGYRPKIVASFPLGDHFIMYRLLGELWEGAHFAGLNAAYNDPPGKQVADILTKIEPKLAGKENTALAGPSPSSWRRRASRRRARTSRARATSRPWNR